MILGLLYALVAAILLFPVWYVDIVPMPDFPTHMARIHVLSVLDTDETLASMYREAWEFLPNMAVDLFSLAAMKFFPVIAAGKLYLSVSVLLWMAGTSWLHRALSGSWSILPLFAAPFFLNASFFIGFLNYMMAGGLCIVSFAAWVSMTSWKSTLRVLCIIPLVVLTYFCHIAGFVILACCLMGYELGRELVEQKISVPRVLQHMLLTSLAIIPVFAIFTFLTPHEGHSGPWLFEGFKGSFTRIKYASFLTIGQPFFAALAFLAGAVGIGLITRKLTIDRRMWPVILGLCLATALAPTKMLGGAFVHLRIPPILGCLGIASLHDRSNKAVKIVCFSLLAVLITYRTVAMVESWTAYQRDYEELERAIEKIDRSAKIFVSQTDPGSAIDYDRLMVYSHILDWITVRRDMFAPLLFAWPAQHPLRPKDEIKELSPATSEQGIPPLDSQLPALAAASDGYPTSRFPYLVHWQCKYDYLLNLRLEESPNPLPAMLKKIQSGNFFTIYKVIPDPKTCG